MKRIRRTSLRVKHSEVFITITQTAAGGGRAAASPADESGPGGRTPELCPECGSPCTADFQSALNELSIPPDLLQAAILEHRLHSFWATTGQFWVCERSLKAIRETQI